MTYRPLDSRSAFWSLMFALAVGCAAPRANQTNAPVSPPDTSQPGSDAKSMESGRAEPEAVEPQGATAEDSASESAPPPPPSEEAKVAQVQPQPAAAGRAAAPDRIQASSPPRGEPKKSAVAGAPPAPQKPALSPAASPKENRAGKLEVLASQDHQVLVQPSVSVPAPNVQNNDRYEDRVDSAFLATAQNPLSTFSIDVDTAAYSNVRRFLLEGQLPSPGAVRIEEMLNYFTYAYPQPRAGAEPFSVNTELTPCPWNTEHQLLRVGLQARAIPETQRPPLNLVFLIDVSGSMSSPDKLPLLKDGLRLLAERMRPTDRISIVTYAGQSGLLLPPTTGNNRKAITDVLDSLSSGGSTNGASGILLAYSTAHKHFAKNAVNRVILATDGDFNVGTSSDADLVSTIEKERQSGVFLTVLGFGRGNLNDSMMEKLADHGNGSYAYIDSMTEARKVLVEQVTGTMVPVAKDVKIQIEMNPQLVASYRLVGYENRALAAQDFNDDRKDAGELGAGQSVTALYELVVAGTANPPGGVIPLKYQQPTAPTRAALSDEVLTVRLRYKLPTASTSSTFSHVVVRDSWRPDLSADQATAAGIAVFGMALRQSPDRGKSTLALARTLVTANPSVDLNGRRLELKQLISRAEKLQGPSVALAR